MSKFRFLAPATLALVGAFVFACDDFTGSDDEEWSADLSSLAEIPTPVGATGATGTAQLTLENGFLTVVVGVNGFLSSDVTMAHIHGPATTSEVAPIVLDFVPTMTAVITNGTRTGTVVSATFDLNVLTEDPAGVLRVSPAALITLLNNGQGYINVHTVDNPAGEIRGQVRRD